MTSFCSGFAVRFRSISWTICYLVEQYLFIILGTRYIIEVFCLVPFPSYPKKTKTQRSRVARVVGTEEIGCVSQRLMAPASILLARTLHALKLGLPGLKKCSMGKYEHELITVFFPPERYKPSKLYRHIRHAISHVIPLYHTMPVRLIVSCSLLCLP